MPWMVWVSAFIVITFLMVALHPRWRRIRIPLPRRWDNSLPLEQRFAAELASGKVVIRPRPPVPTHWIGWWKKLRPHWPWGVLVLVVAVVHPRILAWTQVLGAQCQSWQGIAPVLLLLLYMASVSLMVALTWMIWIERQPWTEWEQSYRLTRWGDRQHQVYVRRPWVMTRTRRRILNAVVALILLWPSVAIYTIIIQLTVKTVHWSDPVVLNRMLLQSCQPSQTER